MEAIVPNLNWAVGLEVWSHFFEFKLPISPYPSPRCGDEPSNTSGEQTADDKDKRKVSLEDVPVHERDSESLQDDPAKTIPVLEADNKGDRNTEDVTQDSTSDSKDVAQSSNGSNRQPPKKAKVKKVPANPDLPSFRATCHRTGKNHVFQSPQAAASFGGAVQDHFGWNVDLDNPDIEVILNINNDHVHVAIALTRESLHRRTITHFGPTTLNPAIAYNMLR